MKCTLVFCEADATEVINLTLKDWPDEVRDYGYCPEHVDDFAASLRELGTVSIRRVDA